MVVPCGNGTIKVRSLIEQAAMRYKKAIAKVGSVFFNEFLQWVFLFFCGNIVARLVQFTQYGDFLRERWGRGI